MLAAIILCVVIWDLPLALVWKLFKLTGARVDIQIIKSAVLVGICIIAIWLCINRKLGIFQTLLLLIFLVLLVAGQISMWRHSKQFGPGSVVFLQMGRSNIVAKGLR